LWVLSRDALSLDAMSGLAITRIARNHAVFVQEMKALRPGVFLSS